MTFTIDDGSIKINLPLTEHTGKARIKKRSDLEKIGVPVAVKKHSFDENCYIEWQIAYDTLDIENSSSKVQFTRTKLVDSITETKSLFELSEYLFFSVKTGLFEISIVDELITFGNTIMASDYIEDNMKPKRIANSNHTINSFELQVYNEELPVLIRKTSNGNMIEMLVRPKQKAVGNQAMIFFDIPITNVQEWSELHNRAATTKELVTFVINRNNKYIIVDLFKCFLLASKQHNLDMLNILSVIKQEIVQNG